MDKGGKRQERGYPGPTRGTDIEDQHEICISQMVTSGVPQAAETKQ